MSTIRTDARTYPAGSRAPGLFRRLRAWFAVARERDALTELDDRMLRDIGITREAALHEAARPFWETGRRV